MLAYFTHDSSCIFWTKEPKDDIYVPSFDISEGSVRRMSERFCTIKVNLAKDIAVNVVIKY